MAKVAIVTGSARGIGRACAHALARASYDIALVDILAPELERTANEIRGMGRQAMTFEADGRADGSRGGIEGLQSLFLVWPFRAGAHAQGNR